MTVTLINDAIIKAEKLTQFAEAVIESNLKEYEGMKAPALLHHIIHKDCWAYEMDNGDILVDFLRKFREEDETMLLIAAQFVEGNEIVLKTEDDEFWRFVYSPKTQKSYKQTNGKVKFPLPENDEEGYEQYKLRWLIEHGYNLKDLIAQLTKLQEDCEPDATIKEIFELWEDDFGFPGAEIWACFDEWRENDYKVDCE